MKWNGLCCVCPLLFCAASAAAAPQDEPVPGSIMLWPGDPEASSPEDSFKPWLEPYTVECEEPRGAVLVFPGGGYGGRADHEGEPIARRFNEAGIHAFVVQYRVSPHRHPAPLLDAHRAIRIVRQRASEWKIDPERVGVLGFSAGGHLAASLSVHFEEPDPEAEDSLARIPARPDATILCYPVISTGKYGHRGSMNNLLGPSPSEDLLETMSLELQVTEKTPPTFLWHTANDEGVPVQNSLLFAEALSKHKVPVELHVYPDGRHGLGLAEEDPHVATWMSLCCQWLKGMGW